MHEIPFTKNGQLTSVSLRGPSSTDEMSANEPGVYSLLPEVLTGILELRNQEQDLISATHVCRLWRSALIYAPFLWTRIPYRNVNETSTYLERSNQCPIEITTQIPGSAPTNDSALALVIPHLGRVKSLEIAPNEAPLPAIFKFHSPAPLLERLTVAGFPPRYISRLPCNFLGGYVPSLRTLSWEGSSVAEMLFGSTDSAPPTFEAWSNPPAPLRVLLGLISSAPHLERLRILIDEDVSPDPVQDVQLNSLRSLDLVSGLALSRVIPHFKVPQLKELRVFLPTRVGPPTMADLLPSGSYPLLTEVTRMWFHIVVNVYRIVLRGEGIMVSVTRCTADTSPTDEFFTATPFSFAQITTLVLETVTKPMAARIGEFINLQQLELTRCEEETEVLSDLSPSPGLDAFVRCPHLRAMKIYFHRPTRHVEDSFKQMVKARKEAGNPLATATLYNSRSLDVGDTNEWLGQPLVLR